MLFPAVLINIPDSKVCRQSESSIDNNDNHKYEADNIDGNDEDSGNDANRNGSDNRLFLILTRIK